MRGGVAYELIFSLLAVAVITAGYVHLAREHAPPPSGLIGHGLGVVGFLLMLSTETLYSLRKRLPNFHWGPMSAWLQAHIFTGIVGSYLVVLHSGWKFHGLAGALTLLTIVIVLSGFIGRYIYTAVPRRLDGVEVQVMELEERIARADQQLRRLGVAEAETAALAAAMSPARGLTLVLARPWVRWRQRRRLRTLVRRLVPNLNKDGRAVAAQLYALLKERQGLQLQMNSLDATRRLLALWHMFHVPLGGVLFTLAAVHIIAALYYATLSR